MLRDFQKELIKNDFRRNKDTNKVEYVGRTNNPVRRQNEHRRDPKKSNLLPLEVKFTGLTVREARVVEQILISTYVIDNLRNARREIATSKLDKYHDSINGIQRSIELFKNFAEDELLNLMGR